MLTKQKEHVQRKIKTFTDNQSDQLVRGCLDVVKVKDNYNHIRERLRAHRENLLNSKIIMATLSRNVRALQFEKELCKTSLGYLAKIKACQNCERTMNDYIQKEDYGKATELILENLRFAESKEMDLVVAVKLLKNEAKTCFPRFSP